MGPRRIERATETSQERNRLRRALDPVSRCWIIKMKLLSGDAGDCLKSRRPANFPACRYATSSKRAVYILSGM